MLLTVSRLITPSLVLFGFLWRRQGSEHFLLCQELYLVNWSLWWGPHKYFISILNLWNKTSLSTVLKLITTHQISLSQEGKDHFGDAILDLFLVLCKYQLFYKSCYLAISLSLSISHYHYQGCQLCDITLSQIHGAVQCSALSIAMQWELDGAGRQPTGL